MAYMTKDGRGPYPNKSGEYCGNHLHIRPFFKIPRLSIKESLQLPIDDPERHIAIMRFGQPHACKAGTIEEMEAEGWVGLYLKEDSTFSMPGDIDIPTPPELMEVL